MINKKEKTLEESRGLVREDIFLSFIKEMNNYGFTEEYIGKCLAQIVYVLEKNDE